MVEGFRGELGCDLEFRGHGAEAEDPGEGVDFLQGVPVGRDADAGVFAGGAFELGA